MVAHHSPLPGRSAVISAYIALVCGGDPGGEKFNTALLVPGPCNLPLVLISFPSAELSPAHCSSPCWEMFP